ncbi:MAG: hypothetical protein QOF43_1640 [Gaiellaceae bacterium]|nr:hypothetical protein [Gaiellaceae bacterium]
MQRLLTTAIIVGLLVATAAAFAVTERLKLTKSAVYGTVVSPVISPTCGCARGRAKVFFKLRRPDDVTVAVLNGRAEQISLLAAGQYPRGPVTLRWNGHTDGGTRAPDGTYRVRIHLAGQHQTIDLPNRIQLDTKAPEVTEVTANRDAFSPDGDRQSDFLRITYALTKPAHVVAYLDGRRVLRSKSLASHGNISWFGVAGAEHLPQGTYTLQIGAVDRSGNSTPVDKRQRVRVEIRFIRLASARIGARANQRFQIGVSTDAKRYRWQLGRRKGTSSSPVLDLLAPGRPGRYTLTVSERGHVNRAAVLVR